MWFYDLPAQLYSVGSNWAFRLVILLSRQHTLAPLLKSLSVVHPLQHQVSVQLSAHTTSPKFKKSLKGSGGHSLHPPKPGAYKVPFSLWPFPSWCLVKQLWITSCLLCETSNNLPSHSWAKSVGTPLKTGAPCPGKGGSHRVVISDQALHIYRHHTWGISLLTYKISLSPIMKHLLYSVQNFISSKIPLIVQDTCQKISQESKLGARASGLSLHILGLHLPDYV